MVLGGLLKKNFTSVLILDSYGYCDIVSFTLNNGDFLWAVGTELVA